MDFDVIVIGAGHAGCEAGLAAARTGKKTLMLATSLDTVAFCACNPSIGGTAKGQIVKDIDALGGEMGIKRRQKPLSAQNAQQRERSRRLQSARSGR